MSHSFLPAFLRAAYKHNLWDGLKVYLLALETVG
jgi:hypothetical protein